nr:MAG TPA: hypothetical protein [Caudoviricetes sp.]
MKGNIRLKRRFGAMREARRTSRRLNLWVVFVAFRS